MKRFLILIVTIAVAFSAAAKTVFYAEKQGEKLYFDHYPAVGVEGSRPCVIFAFGGAFARGTRADKDYLPYFEALTKSGYDVVSIDYRKVLAEGIDTEGLKGAISTMRRAVEYAAEDLISATKVVLENAEKWNIDLTKIVACGSSAGAITALQAENMICNKTAHAQILGDFNYAGIVSFAGAIFSVSGKPKWQSVPCSMMLFHGNADSNVPYNKASAFGVGFYGSKSICKQLRKMDVPYLFYSAEYRNHEIAGEPMYTNIYDVIGFIERYVVKGDKLQIVEHVKDKRYPKTKTRFSVKEYLSTNYSK